MTIEHDCGNEDTSTDLTDDQISTLSLLPVQKESPLDITVTPADDIRYLDLRIIYPLFYLRLHSGLATLYGPGNYEAATSHYRKHGLKEGRCASPFFDPKFYINHPDNSDLRNEYWDSEKGDYDYIRVTNHWLKHGIKEGRQGSRVFDLGFYRVNRGDLASMSFEQAFGHWKKHGNKEGRPTTEKYRLRITSSFDSRFQIENVNDGSNDDDLVKALVDLSCVFAAVARAKSPGDKNLQDLNDACEERARDPYNEKQKKDFDKDKGSGPHDPTRAWQ